MKADRWRRLSEIFGAAIERPPRERELFVEAACGADPSLRREVESLLAAHEGETFLNDLAVPAGVAGAILGAPERLGPYDLLGAIGRGGMGVVYRGRHRETGRLAAVKTVAVPNQWLLAGFRREIHALARLRHPGIVRILDVGVHEGLPWYAMEVLEGERPRARTGPGDLSRVLTLVRRLCDPLAFLHGEGIVHRDLKPDNVLVLESGRPVIVDFGLASSFAGTDGREALEVLRGGGTLAYMAPEQIRGEAVVDARADLYALGCLLYELLTGRPPFAGETAADFARAHLEAAPVPPSKRVAGLPRALDDLVLRLLAKRPSDRVGHAGAVAAALARMGAGAALAGPRPRAYLYRSRFAGREEAMAEAGRRIAALAAGSGGLLLVEGESGVGKTRLATQIAREAAGAGAHVLAGECAPPAARGPAARGAGVVPLEPLRAPLQAIADRCRERGREETGRLLGARGRVLAAYEPSLAGLPGHETYPEPAELADGAARRRLFAYLAETLGALAAEQPVALVLDDLQWADELTLGWLEHLALGRYFDGAPVLLVATYRSEEAGDALRALAASPRAVRLALGRLEESAVASMVGDMLALAPPPRLLSRFLREQSEGNPFFVVEYLRAAVEAGLLWRDDEGRWQVAERSEAAAEAADYERLGLPRSLRAVVERRLEGLPEGAAAAAEAAAVVGREMSAAVLERVSGLGEVDAMEATGELLRRLVLEEVGRGRLRFAHDKLREVACERIEAGRIAALHRAAAEAVEALGDEGDRRPASLGHHWERAGEAAKAAGYYLAGAREARARYANVEAIRLYRAYLGLGADGAISLRDAIAARNELGKTLLHGGRTAEAAEEHARALEEAEALGDRSAEGESADGLGGVYLVQGKTEQARALFERALAATAEAGEPQREARALMAMAVVFSSCGEFEQARGFYERALAIQRAVGDRAGERNTLRNLATNLVAQGRLDESRGCYEQALAIARETGDRNAEGIALCGLADIRQEQGALDEARALFEGALAALREVGNRQFEGIALVNLATLDASEGRVDEAWALYDRALAVSRDMANKLCEGFVWLDSSALARRTGDLEDAERRVGEAEAVFRAIGDRAYEGLCLCERAHVALALGARAGGPHAGETRRAGMPAVPGAIDFLERAREIAEELGLGPESRLGRAVEELERTVRRTAPRRSAPRAPASG